MLPLPRSTFELLLRAARLVDERAIARVQAGGAPQLRRAHTQLFPHITDAGVRQTALAERLGVTKQAIGPLIDDLEAEGVIERVDDPTDRRAKLVRWTPKGRRALRAGLGVLAQLERELAREVGPMRLAALADTLEALIAALSESAGTAPRGASRAGGR